MLSSSAWAASATSAGPAWSRAVAGRRPATTGVRWSWRTIASSRIVIASTVCRAAVGIWIWVIGAPTHTLTGVSSGIIVLRFPANVVSIFIRRIWIGCVIIAFVGFDPDLVSTEQQPAVDGLHAFFCFFPVLGTIIAMFIMKDYNIDENKANSVRDELKAKRA